MRQLPPRLVSPPAIAVTGGIASGKSRVVDWLAQGGDFLSYDADAEVGSLLMVGGQGWCRLRSWLSSAYFADDGTLLKQRLRRAIFDDALLRRRVEADLHPLVLSNLQAMMVGSACPCLVEVPLLYEVGWQVYFDAVLVVYASESIASARLMARDGVSADQARAALQAQLPIQDKVGMADYVVDNSRGWSETLSQLGEIKKKLSSLVQEKSLTVRLNSSYMG